MDILLAVSRGDCTDVQACLETGACVNARDENDMASLMPATDGVRTEAASYQKKSGTKQPIPPVSL